ncbi:uncharacterized protein TNCV_4991621 [Trichonephila clavipes]|nr:uncharacterized protein TNCV_4991621 [Trichonephila clavipes]
MLSSDVLLLHDKARSHVAKVYVEALPRKKWKVLEHPAYSPDLSLCNYHIFGPLKKSLMWVNYFTPTVIQLILGRRLTMRASPPQVRLYSAPHHVEKTEYALRIATDILTHYEKYFGIPFPLKKLAHVTTLEEDLKQQTLCQDSPKDVLSDSGLEIELAIPFVPNRDPPDTPQQSEFGEVVHYHPSE